MNNIGVAIIALGTGILCILTITLFSFGKWIYNTFTNPRKEPKGIDYEMTVGDLINILKSYDKDSKIIYNDKSLYRSKLHKIMFYDDFCNELYIK